MTNWIFVLLPIILAALYIGVRIAGIRYVVYYLSNYGRFPLEKFKNRKEAEVYLSNLYSEMEIKNLKKGRRRYHITCEDGMIFSDGNCKVMIVREV